MGKHRSESETGYLISLVIAIAGLITVAIFHGLSWFGIGIEEGIFQHEMYRNWEFYEIDIVRIDWIFPIWMVVYGLQACWIIYGFVALCRDTKYGSLIVNPPIMPSVMYFTFLFGIAAIAGWVVLWDMRKYAAYSSICSMGSSVFFIMTTGISVYAVKMYRHDPRLMGYTRDVWTIRLLVQNCISAYAAWAAIVTCYTVAMILYSFELLPKDVAEYTALSIMAAFMIVWMLLDVFLGRRESHFIVFPYGIFTVSFLMSFLNFYDEIGSIYFILSAVYMGLSGLFILIKLILCLVHCCRCTKEMKVYIPEEEFGAVKYEEHDDASSMGGLGPNPAYAAAGSLSGIPDDDVFRDILNS